MADLNSEHRLQRQRARDEQSVENATSSGGMTWRSSSPPSSSSWWQNFVTAAVHVKIPSTADVAGLAGGIAVSTPPTAATTSTSASGIHGASSGGGGGGGSSVPSRVIYPFESVSLGNTDSDPLLSGIHPIREADETGGAGKAGGGRGLWRGRDGEDREKEGRDGEAHDDAQGEAQDDAQGEAQDEAQGEAQTWASNRQISQGAGEVAGERASSSAQHLSESMLPPPPKPPALTRSLSLLDLILLGIGASIGSGIFVVTGVAARLAGPSVSLSFLLAGLASLLNALCYADLAARFPGRVGGAYLYAHACLGQLASFVLFCHLVLDYHVGAAAIARSLASYLASLVEVASGVGLPAVLAPGGLPISIPLPFLSPSWLLWWVSDWWSGGQSPVPPVLTLDLSINLVAPAVLLLISWLLCRGVRETSRVNDVMTSTKVAIVVLVVAVGARYVNPANWSPFFPPSLNSLLASAAPAAATTTASAAVPAAAAATATASAASAAATTVSGASSSSVGGVQAMLSAASLVFFSYIGFDAVANTAEESLHPRRDVPRGLLLSLAVCSLLYISVSLVLTGMVHFTLLDPSAPLSSAFSSLGLHFMERIIDIGAVVGLTTTLLTGLYVQSRMYLALARDGMLPGWFLQVNGRSHVPVHAQWWVGGVAAVMAAGFDVGRLSHILSVGVLLSYSIVCMCVLALRVERCHGGEGGCAGVEGGGGDQVGDALLAQRGLVSTIGTTSNGPATMLHARVPPPPPWIAQWGGDKWHEAVVYVCVLVACVLSLGFATRFAASWLLLVPLFLLSLASSAPIFLSQRFSVPASGFACPWVPFVPLMGICVNMYLLAQTHMVAWMRLFVLTVVALVGFWWNVKWTLLGSRG